MGGVDFVVNCYERTYRELLAPDALEELVGQHCFRFARRTLLINNVADRTAAERLAEAARERGAIDTFAFVEDHFERALKITGLRSRQIRRLPHFTDCCLVGATLSGPDWMVYWDADVTLLEPHDWITPSLAYMAAHGEVAVANPDNWFEGLAEQEALRIDGDFAIGYGFGDTGFLMRRSELAQPIYRYLSVASWRHPLAHVEPIIEQRVDAYMRRKRRLRATYLRAEMRHAGDAGLNYPHGGTRERVRGSVMRRVFALAQRSDHPALRAWPR